MGIKHKFHSAIDDEGMPQGAVKPSNWNDDHDVDGLLGGLIALGLQPNVIPYLDASQNGGVIPISDFVRTLVMNVADAPAFRAIINAASIDSPSFAGSPTALTQAPGDNSTRLATTAYTDAAITALIDGAPTALDTLNELATALADDANFASTVTNSLALKAPLNSPTLTGAPLAPTAPAGDNSSKIATTAYADAAVSVLNTAITAALALKAPLASPALTGSPTAPTVAGSTDSTTAIATTAFVQAVRNALAAVARTGAYSDLSGKPTLGTAAALDVGTTASKVVQLDASAKLPAVDGSLLTGVAATLARTQAFLAANVGMPVAGSWYDAFTVSGLVPGGVYLVIASLNLKDTAAASPFVVRVVDSTAATTYGSSGYFYTTGASARTQGRVACLVTAPASGTIKAQAQNAGTNNGVIVSDDTGLGQKDSNIITIRIA